MGEITTFDNMLTETERVISIQYVKTKTLCLGKWKSVLGVLEKWQSDLGREHGSENLKKE